MKLRYDLFFLTTLTTFYGRANAQKGFIMNGDNEGIAVDGEYIVIMENNPNTIASFSASTAESLVAGVTGKVKEKAAKKAAVNSIFTKALTGFAVEGMTESAARMLADTDGVLSVEPNMVINIEQQTVTWGIDRVDQRDLPLSNSFTPDGSGAGVAAYIIDTGVQVSHNEFGGANGRARWGINTSGDGEDRDCHGHGTHVAGTVGGTVYGVAKDVEIIAVKVLTCSGSGSTTGVINGVEWVATDAAANNKPATANMSLGGGFSNALNAAVKALNNGGVPTVVAAGNDNGDACTKSPASEPDVITVGSTTSTDARSSFSNFGSCLDIYAPGSGITAAWIGNDSATNTISGTSMASPHVCGGAALLLGNNVAPEDVVTELISRSTQGKVTDPKEDSPNALLYIGAIGPTNAPTPAPPTPVPTPCIQSILEVEITTDNYPAETSWTLTNDCTGEDQESRQSFAAGGTTYTDEECVPAAEYTFTISDQYGDGICCSYGSGSYTVTYNGDVVKEGGQFGSSESTTFGSCDQAVAPTDAPVAPTDAPVAPTDAPVAPTDAPVAPTDAPVAPTDAPVAPTGSPVAPTGSPIAPTGSPVAPITAPVAPITAPVETIAPVAAPTPDMNCEEIFSEAFDGETFLFAPNRFIKEHNGDGKPEGKSARVKKEQKLTKAWVDIRGKNYSKLHLKFSVFGKNLESSDDDGIKVQFRSKISGPATPYENNEELFLFEEDFGNRVWTPLESMFDVPDGAKRVQMRFIGNMNENGEMIFIDSVSLCGSTEEEEEE